MFKNDFPRLTQRVALALGILLLTSGLLVFELVSVRLLSAVFLHSYSFIVIALALLGMGAGAVWVHLRPFPSPENLPQRLMLLALLAGGSSLLPLLLRYASPTTMHSQALTAPATALMALGISILLAMPFFFGSAILSILFRSGYQGITKLYSIDFIGSAFGSLAYLGLLSYLNPFQSLIIVAILLVLSGVLFYNFPTGDNRHRWVLGIVVVLTLLVPLASKLTLRPKDLGAENIFARWNPFSYVTVTRSRSAHDVQAPTWRTDFNDDVPEREQYVRIDNDALTALLRSDPDLKNSGTIKKSFGALPYYVAPSNPKVAIIGAGGGPDVLTALHFNAQSVTGIEINGTIIDAVRGQFSEYTGNIYHRPDVHIVHDDARSYFTHTKQNFDVIVSTLVDSWAASSTGSFATTESYLYTAEAFVSYLNHLTPQGWFVETRWTPELPQLLALTEHALRQYGATNPGNHLLVFRRGLLTSVVVSPQSLSSSSKARARETATALNVELLFPNAAQSFEEFATSISSGNQWPNPQGFIPSDNRPFYFFSAAGSINLLSIAHEGRQAVRLLVIFFWVILCLGIALIVVPLLATNWKTATKGWNWKTARALGYFLLTGTGFFLIEVVFIQRLTLFLGKPEYSLAVTLFTFLFFGGWGSLVSARVKYRWLPLVIITLAAVAVFYLWLLPTLFTAITGWDIAQRIALALALTAPLGFCIGMPFPSGIRAFTLNGSELVPWFWATSSIASVFGSLLAVVLSLNHGFTFTILTGASFYLAAGILLLLDSRRAYQANSA